MDIYSLPEAAKGLGYKTGKIRSWYDLGLLKPTKPVKRGESFQLVKQDLHKLKLFQALVDRGFYRDQIKEIVAGYKDDQDFLAVSKTAWIERSFLRILCKLG